MTRNIIITCLTLLLISACASPVEPAPPYYFVTVPADATPTPTPFQPAGAVLLIPENTPTLPPPLPTLVPLPGLPTQDAQPTAEIIATPQPVIDAPDVITFLLLGSDLRPGASFRTDTILIAILRPNDGQVSLISVPRDLWVNIPQVGTQRINTAYQFGIRNNYPGGGPGLLKDTLLHNLGIQIDHTAMVDFDGFRKIVNTLGGIDVPVACPYTDWHLISPDYDPENENNWELYTAGPGLMHMDGDLALWYARSRQKSSDFDRGRRQQEVIRALYAQALRSDSIAQLPQLYDDFSTSIQTDLGLGDILVLSPLALQMGNADIRSYYIAGDLITPWITPGGAYVLLPNSEAIQAMLARAIAPSDIQETRQTFKVEIQNGSAFDGWDTLAAERLNYAGFETSLHPADHRLHAQTLLYDLSPDQDAARASSLLAVLGLQTQALVSLPGQTSDIAYVLLMGNDYQPCFKPAQLAP